MAEEPRAPSVFTLDIPGAQSLMVREVGGLGGERQAIETTTQSRDGAKRVIRKVAGNVKYQNITIKAAASNDRNLWDWWKKVQDGDFKASRYDGKITDPELSEWAQLISDGTRIEMMPGRIR
jgi:phage tail-like protein